jgi:hypothetical protein
LQAVGRFHGGPLYEQLRQHGSCHQQGFSLCGLHRQG